MTFRKYLILAAVAIFAACGDFCLARGMRELGPVTLSSWPRLFTVVFSPWILAGVCLLVLYFSAYLSSLSWADLTYVLPATALSYVLMALLGKVFLHENVTISRWLGIALITVGVGFVASGPSLTSGYANHAHHKTVMSGGARSDP